MNTFYEHHHNNIQFGYRCFDRILLNGLIQPFQQPERVIGFFNAYRDAQRLTRKYLRDIAEQFGNCVKNRCQKWGAPLLEAPDGRRDDFVDRFFRGAKPNKITTIFGRKVTKDYKGKLHTVIEDIGLPNPVIRSHYGHGFIKQYVRDHLLFRTEPATNNVNDYGVKKAVENLPQLRQRMDSITDNYLNVQQDILETFVDRHQLKALAAPTILPGAKRIPGLKLDHPRQLALMHALVRFANVAASNSFRTCDLHAPAAAALGCTLSQYRLSSLRYDLSKLRAKGLVEKIPHSSRYRLLPQGYSICLVFLKLFERIYAPLTVALLCPFSADTKLCDKSKRSVSLCTLQKPCKPGRFAYNICDTRRSQLDRLYAGVVFSLDRLLQAVGLRKAA